MIEPLTPNTQAILLLTAPLLTGQRGTSCDLLGLSDYNRLTRILRAKQNEPADLIAPDADDLIEACAEPFGRERLDALLGRGFLLSQAVERWNSRAIWVISRADARYPKRLKTRLKEAAPPLLYGCGDIALLEKGGLAVVGSRATDDELINYTEKVGRISAEAHRLIVSGGARGIDQAAMRGAIMAGGEVAGVIAESLEKAALSRHNREPLMEGRLVLVSPYDPAAGFNVGHAMQRNKLIYALADAALVVTSDFQKGGTWAGAIEQLDRLRYVPVFVRNDTNSGKGIEALLKRGGRTWPDPENGSELLATLQAAMDSVASEPRQGTLPLRVEEEPANCRIAPVVAVSVLPTEPTLESYEQTSTDTNQLPSTELYSTVRAILLRELTSTLTEEDVAKMLDVTKTQAKAWLARLIEDEVVEKVNKSRPARFRITNDAEWLI